MKKILRKTALILLSVLMALSMVSCASFEALDATATEMLTAFLAKDAQKMSELGHPDYAIESEKYEAYFAVLELEYGSEIYESSIDSVKATTRSISAYDTKYGGSVAYSEYVVVLSGEEYVMKCATVKNDNGEGVVQFDFGG